MTVESATFLISSDNIVSYRIETDEGTSYNKEFSIEDTLFAEEADFVIENEPSLYLQEEDDGWLGYRVDTGDSSICQFLIDNLLVDDLNVQEIDDSSDTIKILVN